MIIRNWLRMSLAIGFVLVTGIHCQSLDNEYMRILLPQDYDRHAMPPHPYSTAMNVSIAIVLANLMDTNPAAQVSRTSNRSRTHFIPFAEFQSRHVFGSTMVRQTDQHQFYKRTNCRFTNISYRSIVESPVVLCQWNVIVCSQWIRTSSKSDHRRNRPGQYVH